MGCPLQGPLLLCDSRVTRVACCRGMIVLYVCMFDTVIVFVILSLHQHGVSMADVLA